MSVADRAEIAFSVVPTNVSPAGTDGTGAGTIVQAVPFQCSISARLPSLRPTAQASAPARAATPNRIDLDPPVVAGVGTIVQVAPSKWAAIGSVCLNPVMFCEPTAQTSLAEAADTALSFSS